jgi:hypothetical protein
MEDLSEAFGLNQRASALDPETVSETDVSQLHAHRCYITRLPIAFQSGIMIGNRAVGSLKPLPRLPNALIGNR